MRKKLLGLCLAIPASCAVLAGHPRAANATFETLVLSGDLDTDSGFYSIGPFATPTPFSISLTFDSTGAEPGLGYDTLAVSNSITVAGYGTFTSPDVFFTILDDPSDPAADGDYIAGFADVITDLIAYEGFGTASPPFSAIAPTPSVLSDELGLDGQSSPINLSNGDVLYVDGFTGDLSAEIRPAPEPASLALLAASLAGLLLVRRRSNT